MSLAHAVVTVAVHVVAGVAVMQVDVGGAVRAAAGAELRQITRVTGFAAWSACWLELHSNVHGKQQSLGKRQRGELRRIYVELFMKTAVKKVDNIVAGVSEHVIPGSPGSTVREHKQHRPSECRWKRCSRDSYIPLDGE